MGLENLNYAVTVGSIVVSVIAGVFWAGFYFNKRIKEACAEQNRDVEDNVIKLTTRIEKLETEYVPVQRYERDLEDLKTSIKDLHGDMKSSMSSLTGRIDLFMTKGN